MDDSVPAANSSEISALTINSERGAVASSFIASWALTSFAAGYYSGSFYKSHFYPNPSPDWIKVFALTTMIMPTIGGR